ncbi:MAG: hypothetical protein LBI33_12570 [Propionibacteriaceae bacterium]|nr:hypothetical protein [Propionibacteriaceae bacterium]
MKKRLLATVVVIGLVPGCAGIGASQTTAAYVAFSGLGCSSYYDYATSSQTYTVWAKNINCSQSRSGVNYVSSAPTVAWTAWSVTPGTGVSTSVTTPRYTGRTLEGVAPTGATWSTPF